MLHLVVIEDLLDLNAGRYTIWAKRDTAVIHALKTAYERHSELSAESIPGFLRLLQDGEYSQALDYYNDYCDPGNAVSVYDLECDEQLHLLDLPAEILEDIPRQLEAAASVATELDRVAQAQEEIEQEREAQEREPQAGEVYSIDNNIEEEIDETPHSP